MPSRKLRKGLIPELKDLLLKYRNHQDSIDLHEKWSGVLTREEKLAEALDMIL